MVKLIATIYLLMNGVPVGEPVQRTYKDVFADVAACQSFIQSDAGKTQLEHLNELIVAQLPEGGSHTVTTSCELAKDNTI